MYWTNEYMNNFINDGPQPRVVAYFKNHQKIVVICFRAGNYVEYDHVNDVVTPINSLSNKGWTVKDRDNFDKSLCKKIYNKLISKSKTNDEIIQERYTFTKERKKLTDKEFQLIAKYEQRKKGDWSDREEYRPAKSKRRKK